MKIRLDRPLVSALTALLTWGVMEAALAAPYQLPLLGASPVAPNVVFTLDDSGSMLLPLMPDNLTSDQASGPYVNIQTLAPEEVVNSYTYYTVDRGRLQDSGFKAYGLIPTRLPSRSSAEYLADARRRSSQVNTIYYNPEIRYEPWTNSDGSLKAYPTAASTSNWTKVLQDPMGSAITDFTPKALPNNTKWCLTIGACDSRENANLGDPEANAQADYDPTVYYVLDSTTAPTQAGTKRISIWNMRQYTQAGTSNISAFTRGAQRTDCTAASGGQYTCSKAQELKNFATWYMYHRTRLMLAKASVSKAFGSPDVTGFRLGWGALNNSEGTASTDVDGTSTTTLRQGVRNFDTTHKKAFYDWLFQKPAFSGTPLRKATYDIGQYFSREDNKGPWADGPGTSNTQTVASFAACRRAFHILTTDGYWSTGNTYAAGSTATTADVESTDGPEITNLAKTQKYQYKASDAANARYKDGVADLLGDVAMYYWSRDIAPKMDNKISPTAKNQAFWQHMVNYTVGLGTSGNLVNPTDLAALEAGTKKWQASGTTSSNISEASKADDLWHAAYNSRGENLSAANSQQFATALSNILLDIANESNSTAGVGLSGTILTTEAAKYVPQYSSVGWGGDLSKFAIDINTFVASDTATWTAAKKIPEHGSRNIFVWKDATNKAVPFSLANLNSTMISEMGTSATVNADLINYLRGDASKEVGNATGTGIYRARSSALGDIVNSPPLYTGATLDFQYETLSLPSTSPSYRTFVNGLKTRAPVVYVGANDGMLHAFRDSDGTEVFAYIPREVLPNLSALSSVTYGHRYFVDGPLIEAHALWGSSWKSVLLGTLGAGGKGLFALDITNPSSLQNTSTGGSQVLWEINSATSSNVGYIFSEPQVGPMKINGNYTWVAIVGNGVESASNKAQLLVIELSTGNILATLDTKVGDAASPNGLGGVRVVRNVEGVITAAYAGDLLGNVWRFNLAGKSSTDWNVAFNTTPLFKAVDKDNKPQPITAAPSVLLHPRGGNMVVVGTGKLIYEADRPGVSAAASQTQTIYGLWDKYRGLANPTDTSKVITGKNLLLEQTITTTAVTTNTDGRSFYEISNSRPNWSTQRGWYLNLTLGVGQRVTYPGQLFRGLVLMGTVVPTTSTACSSAGAYNGLFDALTGSVNNQVLIDTNGDGIIDTADKSAGWYNTANDGRDQLGTRSRQSAKSNDPNNPQKNNYCPGGYIVTSSKTSKGICIPAQNVTGARTWRVLTNPPRAY